VASEVMAVLCLAETLPELKERLGDMLLGYSRNNNGPIYARDLKAHGAMTALLHEAFRLCAA